MFRLVDDEYQENKELHNVAVYCLTKTIKAHLEEYFEEGYENEKENTLYSKVKLDEVYKLIPDKLIKNMEIAGVNISLFIPKKMAQFMFLLKSQDEITPDIFLEYILYRMMIKQSEKRYDYITSEVCNKIAELKRLLRSYAKDELCIDEVKERNKYVKDHTILLTEFTRLLGVEEPDDDSLTFWDWDYSYFDDWGFEKTIKELSCGSLGHMRGYGMEYTKSIFTDVSEKFPLSLIY